MPPHMPLVVVAIVFMSPCASNHTTPGTAPVPAMPPIGPSAWVQFPSSTSANAPSRASTDRTATLVRAAMRPRFVTVSRVRSLLGNSIQMGSATVWPDACRRVISPASRMTCGPCAEPQRAISVWNGTQTMPISIAFALLALEEGSRSGYTGCISRQGQPTSNHRDTVVRRLRRDAAPHEFRREKRMTTTSQNQEQQAMQDDPQDAAFRAEL